MFMIVAGVVLSIGALQYEFKQGSSGEYTGQPVYEYGMLTPQEQHVVDGALNGKTYAFDSSESLPSASRPGFRPKNVKVHVRGADRTFTYRTVFPATSPKGLGTISLIGGGLLAMFEAVRRQHFSTSWPWQTG
ncbi:hypothetical protein ZOD2009_12697 [Haladaptatus paucihalophilus DX253]|uniref:Uncharacterized protein n=1 Tax=Haladaptatus paucihalophilus DX253 TaxID=797209 RepID=E7QUQ5_HALPU|nr:hypothetical protein [Haladaptatus paucihalophilus]EFW91712.1 hypothetical protein ZOD2009_12697 [Haladaptatus paucihalophilus DX253]SHJ96370.1 hypothetical protein SAMN05444342_0090 [Haladaptatus paucihalophilus DX253]